jgi:predicted HTH domain antitoxin
MATESQKVRRLAKAIRLYSQGLISQEKAAAIANLDRTDFLMTLAREKVDAFHVNLDQLAREICT